MENTLRFARGLPANNAMLWGARGMGKSSLVKAAHASANAAAPGSLALVEIHREEIRTLPELMDVLRPQSRRCLVFCDDLSFERGDSDYKALKSVLDGGIEGRPENVLFYATSNRRHLMPRDMIENERSTAINPSEATEEKVSLSDRFGLWIGFHNCDQPTYFAMVEGYAAAFGLPIGAEELRREANEWSVTRGARSGRVAWQFIQDLAGRLGAAAGGGPQAPDRSSSSGAKPPKIIRLPSNTSPIDCGLMRGSAMTFAMPASRASLDGHSIQENTTTSPSSAFTARRKSVSLPSGTSSPQHSTTRVAPFSRKTGAAWRPACGKPPCSRWHRDHESIDLAHACAPIAVRRGSAA